MKKILSIVAIGALFTSYGFGATLNKINLKGSVASSATVDFVAVSSALESGVHKFLGYDMATATVLPLDIDTTLIDTDVYLKTNDSTKTINMKLTGNTLTSTASTATPIDLKFYYGGATDTVDNDTDFQLASNGTNAGTTAISGKKLKITAKPAINQVAGEYTGTVTVAISAQ